MSRCENIKTDLSRIGAKQKHDSIVTLTGSIQGQVRVGFEFRLPIKGNFQNCHAQTGYLLKAGCEITKLFLQLNFNLAQFESSSSRPNLQDKKSDLVLLRTLY